MGMSTPSVCWISLAVVLSLSSFGLYGCFWIAAAVFAFIAGTGCLLYEYTQQQAVKWMMVSYSVCRTPPAVGIPKVVDGICKGKVQFQFDKRMTGSTAIDEVLHEVIDYTYRDFVRAWYQRLSDDDQFHNDVCKAVQRVIIAFSERAKDVDLTPYLTTQLVDDFASHIRLYRRSLAKVIEHRKDDTKPPVDLESVFFDLETEMENNSICRDQICLSEAEECQYLREVLEVLMFLLLPADDFHSCILRFIVREVLVTSILIPSIHRVSSPDFINQTITWLCKDTMFNSESFLTILKTSDNTDELQAVKEKVDLEIARLRSRDTGDDDDTVIKQQLSSLYYLRTVCDTRQQLLNDGVADTDNVLPGEVEFVLAPGQELYQLKFDVIFANNIALSYFIEFMHGIGADRYVYFYLAVEGFRVSAEQQISAAYLATGTDDLDRIDLEMLREAAVTLFNQYLSDKASPRVQTDEALVKDVSEKLDEGNVTESIFDAVQAKVWDELQSDRYFEAFKKSKLYIKLLAELDLLQDATITKSSHPATDIYQNGFNASSSGVEQRESLDDAEVISASSDGLSTSDGACSCQQSQRNTYTLSAHIAQSGPCTEHGVKYTVYLISVSKQCYGSQHVEKWNVFRRYSDFHDFHMLLQEKYDTLSGLVLPSKRAFDNMNKEFLEKRTVSLNTYLQTLLSPSLLNTHRGLVDLVQQFLEHMHWERGKSDLARKMDMFVNPFRSSVRNVSNIVRAMPDNFVDGVARVSGGFRSIPNNMLDGVGKMLNVKGASGMAPAIKAELLECGKVSASLDAEGDEDSIPLHIMLLLMDEVFDLKSRNQWLRRRIVAILQQIAKTMFGDSINRKIVEHVLHFTSSDQVAEYIKLFRDNFWPGGTLREPRTPRDHNTRMRTRVVCKAKLFASLSEELQHLIGSETTRQGVMLVFNMFQYPRLNRRLAYVIVEGVLETIFTDRCFPETFHKIHAQSPRLRRDQQNRTTTTTQESKNARKR